MTQNLAKVDWRAHHLINLAAVRDGDAVIRAATRAGWLPNEEANVAALPHTRAAQETLRNAKVRRPVHDSGHPDWIKRVRLGLRNIKTELDKRFDEAESSDKDRAALDALRKLQAKLRKIMRKEDRLTMLEEQPSQQNA